MSALRAFSSVFYVARVPSVSRNTFVFRSLRVAQQPQLFRGYAASASLTKEAIETRVLDVIKSFEKVKPEKITTLASFAEDLGLDSLDAVEVVMAVEEEFSIEIPDEEADAITTVQQAIDYIHKTPAAR